MFYRVTMDLAFTEEDEARDFFHDGEIALPKASIINPGSETEERGYIRLQKCYHDQDPNEPCIELDYQELPD